jgi:hypothetical protein
MSSIKPGAANFDTGESMAHIHDLEPVLRHPPPTSYFVLCTFLSPPPLLPLEEHAIVGSILPEFPLAVYEAWHRFRECTMYIVGFKDKEPP